MYGSVSTLVAFSVLVTIPDFMIDLVRPFSTQTTQMNAVLTSQKKPFTKRENRAYVCLYKWQINNLKIECLAKKFNEVVDKNDYHIFW
jgi:hypothetical protein